MVHILKGPIRKDPFIRNLTEKAMRKEKIGSFKKMPIWKNLKREDLENFIN